MINQTRSPFHRPRVIIASQVIRSANDSTLSINTYRWLISNTYWESLHFTGLVLRALCPATNLPLVSAAEEMYGSPHLPNDEGMAHREEAPPHRGVSSHVWTGAVRPHMPQLLTPPQTALLTSLYRDGSVDHRRAYRGICIYFVTNMSWLHHGWAIAPSVGFTNPYLTAYLSYMGTGEGQPHTASESGFL